MIIFYLILTLVVTAIYFYLRLFNKKKNDLNNPDDSDNTLDNNLLVSHGELDWKTINKHSSLKELISFEGVTIAGEKYQMILSISAGNQIHLIYCNVGSEVFRVRAGDISLNTVKSGEGLRIRFSDNLLLITDLKDVTSKSEAHEYVVEGGFQLVILLTNSLIDGLKIRYAARAASNKCDFIKEWDIPTTRSDAARFSEVSALADLAELSNRVKDIIFTSTVGSGNESLINIKPGFCYVLGHNGGEKVTILCESDIAIMIVPEFGQNISLSDFIKSLNVTNQMHARVIYLNGEISIASQDSDGVYGFVDLAGRNIILGIIDDSGIDVAVLRVESVDSSASLMSLKYIQSEAYKNVVLWRLTQDA